MVSLTCTADYFGSGCYLFIAQADLSISYQGDGASGIYLWGTQAETGSAVSIYVPTTSAAASAYFINPATVIRRVLWNMGVADYDIDVPSFDAAAETFASWSLAWNFAFYYKEDRAAVLSRLLAMCHSCIVIGEKIRLQVLSKTSQATVTNATVLKMQEVGPDTFRYTDAIAEKVSDSGYVAFQQAGEAQDLFIKALVPAKSSTDVIDRETITFPGVQDSQHVQKLGMLYYQRKFLKSADVSFTGKGTLLALRPDDVITINYADYGGSYAVLIVEVTIGADVSVNISAIRFSEALDDWGDLAPGAITIARILHDGILTGHRGARRHDTLHGEHAEHASRQIEGRADGKLHPARTGIAAAGVALLVVRGADEVRQPQWVSRLCDGPVRDGDRGCLELFEI
jgi:hypothetical protein